MDHNVISQTSDRPDFPAPEEIKTFTKTFTVYWKFYFDFRKTPAVLVCINVFFCLFLRVFFFSSYKLKKIINNKKRRVTRGQVPFWSSLQQTLRSPENTRNSGRNCRVVALTPSAFLKALCHLFILLSIPQFSSEGRKGS